jgi:hypothetical protein
MGKRWVRAKDKAKPRRGRRPLKVEGSINLDDVLPWERELLLPHVDFLLAGLWSSSEDDAATTREDDDTR